MAYYRLYFRKDGPGRPISGVEAFDAADDVAATREAAAFAGSHAMELWCGKRIVRLYAAKAATVLAPHLSAGIDQPAASEHFVLRG